MAIQAKRWMSYKRFWALNDAGFRTQWQHNTSSKIPKEEDGKGWLPKGVEDAGSPSQNHPQDAGLKQRKRNDVGQRN